MLFSAVWMASWACGAEPEQSGVFPLDLTALRNVDALGDHKGALLDAASWADAVAAAGSGLVLPDAAAKLDAVALKSIARPKAPKRVDVATTASGEFVHLLAALTGDVPRGAQILRVYFGYQDGTEATVEVKAGEGIFPVSAYGSSDTTRALTVGDGRALSLISLRNPRPNSPLKSLGIESRNGAASSYLFSLAIGAAIPGNPLGPSERVAGFPFDLDLGSPPPPIPGEWKVVGPAGSHGKVEVKDGHYAFSDGTRARFWGINLLQESCAPPKELAPKLAKELADYGFNLVRLHHCDTVRSGIIKADRKAGESPFDPAGLDRLDFLVAELAKVGIYTWLEVATNRAFTEADGVSRPGPDIPNGHKLVSMFEPDWHDAYLVWTRAWLGRTNPYTGKTLASDPAIAVVELGNEHSMLVNFNSGGTEKLGESHRAALDARWAEFVHSKYTDEKAAAAAWAGSVNPGLRPDETFVSPSRRPFGQANFSAWPEARARDLFEFYRGLDEAFFADVSREVKTLGFTNPLVAGITFGTPAFARIAANYDGMDGHFEWDPSGTGNLRNDSMIASPRQAGLPDRWDDAQWGKPFSLSELSESHPNIHEAESPLFWASMASIQDWDALIWLNYTNGEIKADIGAIGGVTELRSAAVKWGQMAVASGLFRSGEIPSATGLSIAASSAAEARETMIAGEKASVAHARDVRFLLANLVRSAVGQAPGSVAGTPGNAVGWWVDAARFVVDTPRFAAVLGDHALRFRAGRGEGAGPVSAAGFDPQLDGEAAASLVCLDGTRLDSCRRALLTVAGAMQNADAVTTGGGSTVYVEGVAPPVLSRPGGAIRFAWPRKPTVRAVRPDGGRGEPIAVRTAGSGWWSLNMADAGSSLWWEIDG